MRSRWAAGTHAAIHQLTKPLIMPPTFTEDTIIGSSPNHSGSPLYLDSANAAADSYNAEDSVLERCRSVFRQIGRRLSSFELSRQIYG
jgi:hypothetical protein